MSVMTTLRAPACRTTAAAMMPIGPAPVMSTSSPSTRNSARCAPRCRRGRRSRRRRGRSGGCAARRWSRARDVLREGAVPLDADAHGVGAEVAPAGQAVAATAADDVPLAADQVADVDVGHRSPDLDHLAGELVAEDHRRRDGRLRPGVPGPDVEIGAADARPQDPYQHITGPDGRLRDVLEPEPGLAVPLHECFHPTHAKPPGRGRPLPRRHDVDEPGEWSAGRGVGERQATSDSEARRDL